MPWRAAAESNRQPPPMPGGALPEAPAAHVCRRGNWDAPAAFVGRERKWELGGRCRNRTGRASCTDSPATWRGQIHRRECCPARQTGQRSDQNNTGGSGIGIHAMTRLTLVPYTFQQSPISRQPCSTMHSPLFFSRQTSTGQNRSGSCSAGSTHWPKFNLLTT